MSTLIISVIVIQIRNLMQNAIHQYNMIQKKKDLGIKNEDLVFFCSAKC